MHLIHKELYNNLIKLCDNEAFYYIDQEYGEYTIRSFSYRLASYNDFKLPSALEARGTSFYSKDKKNWKLFTRNLTKFFNLNEGIPKEEYIASCTIKESYEKMDGSLISFGIIDGNIIAKSKTSILSDQAIIAQNMIDNFENLQRFIKRIYNSGYTPIFELIGPCNRIVLPYQKDELIALALVNNSTAEITPLHENHYFVKEYNLKAPKKYKYTWNDLLHIQENEENLIEGFVVYSSCGLCKVKTKKYIHLHSLKDNINNIKTLTELILDDNLDDLFANFNDKETLDYIISMQEKISHTYNHLISTIEKVHFKYKHLQRKEFAITCKDLYPNIFGLLMSKYLGKDPDYKKFFIKNKMYEN